MSVTFSSGETMPAIKDRESVGELVVLIDLSPCQQSSRALKHLEVTLTQLADQRSSSFADANLVIDIDAGDLIITPGMMSKLFQLLDGILGEDKVELRMLFAQMPQTQQTALDEGLMVQRTAQRDLYDAIVDATSPIMAFKTAQPEGEPFQPFEMDSETKEDHDDILDLVTSSATAWDSIKSIRPGSKADNVVKPSFEDEPSVSLTLSKAKKPGFSLKQLISPSSKGMGNIPDEEPTNGNGKSNGKSSIGQLELPSQQSQNHQANEDALDDMAYFQPLQTFDDIPFPNVVKMKKPATASHPEALPEIKPSASRDTRTDNDSEPVEPLWASNDVELAPVKRFDEQVEATQAWVDRIETTHGFADDVQEPEVLMDLPTETLYHKQNLRSGQVLNVEGNVVIMGDAHSGCEISATGDIIIWGTLSGTAHAGVTGNTRAEIHALKIEAVQLRIAHTIARRPDRLFKADEVNPGVGPEVARIVNNEIQVFQTGYPV